MDLGFEIGFDRPWFLLLLLLIPVIWILSYNSLAGLGPWRRLFALGLRTFVFSLLVCALAQMQWKKTTDRLTVIYLLDQSDSIPQDKREYMLDYAFEAVRSQRREMKNDMAGVIIFGGNAKIESAPYDGDLPLIGRIESGYDLKTGSTSLESALKLAKASFPEDTARRVVIMSDGNQNVGDALAMAQAMAEDGIGIDVVPVELVADSEVSVDKVAMPTDIRKGQEFEARVVLTSDTEPSDDNPTGEVTGTIKVTKKTAQSDELVAQQKVKLTPGKNIFPFTHKIDRSAVYTFDATFTPDDKTKDLISQNNTASTFTHVRGKGKVLLIEDFSSPGEFLHLVQRLQANSIEVDVMSTDRLFASAAELISYDSVILANVARASGGDDANVGDISSFSDDQIQMLVRNVEEMGAGLVMLGGDRSFGAGGWSNSPLEKAMPVDFQIKNDKVDAVGALVLMMHACEMANGNFWQTKTAEESIKVLGPMDYCGVVGWKDFNGTPRWEWRLGPDFQGIDRVNRNRNKMMGIVNRMAPGDMMDFNAPMRLALNGLKKVDASMKHMIVISDGDPTPPTNALLREFAKGKIRISTVAIGTHGPAGSTPLQKIAKATGGKYYVVKNPQGLPKIFQREARRVAKPVIKESRSGMAVVPMSKASTHEIMQGIDVDTIPPFIGYVMTTIKKNPLVEQLAVASDPKDGGENSTLIATWRYGLGRATAFTSDAGHKWTADWLNDDQYDKLFVQMIRHSMRPITKDANFTVSSEVRDGKAKVVVTALDDKEEQLNFLNMSGRGVGTNGKGFDLEFTQVGPGRYVAEHAIEGSGNVLMSIFPDEGYERLTAGVNVPYSTEYSDRESDLAFLDQLTKFEPRGGGAGELIKGTLSKDGIDDLLQTNTFRPTLRAAIGIQDIWPLLVLLCGTAFFADVFVRRVAVTFDWVGDSYRAAKTYFTGEQSEERESALARLQSRKAEIEKDIEQRRAATKFEPVVDENAKVSGKKRLEDVLASEIEKTPTRAKKIERDDLSADQDESYTSRLLDAKRKAQQDQTRRDRNLRDGTEDEEK